MGKISDKQHKAMIAMFADCQNYSLVAKAFGVSPSTVRRHLVGDAETAKKVQQKKEENTAAILQYMGKQKKQVCGILDVLLNALDDPDKIANATLPQIATALGIIIDKYSRDEGIGQIDQPENNLFEVIAQSTGEEMDTSAIPEIEPSAESGHDVVE